MGKRGPKPTPTATLKLKRSWRANARGAEVQPDATPPGCPDWLDDYAKETWARLAPHLSESGTLTAIDGEALAAFCQAAAEFRHATEAIRREGRVVRGDDKLRPHPAVAQQRSAWQAIKDFGALFGLSPSARVGLPAAAPQADPLEDFLNTLRPGSRVPMRDRGAKVDEGGAG